MNMIRLMFCGLSLCIALAGCGGPDAVTQGMSNDDAKAAIDKMKPEDKIRAIASSPLPQKEKDAKYAEIEKETGVKASEVLTAGNSAPQNGH